MVRYAVPGILPPGVSEPEVTFDGGILALSALVAIKSFPDLDQVVGILPDTVPVRMEGELVSSTPSRSIATLENDKNP